MAATEHDHLFKVLLIGDSGMGKSKLLLRFADDVYDDHTAPAIGVDFKVCTRTIEGKQVKLTLWDTAGHERFRKITSSYYRGAHGIIIVYDISDRESFSHARCWMQESEKYSTPSAVRMLVGNKCDLASKRVMSTEEGRELAHVFGVQFLETSARNAHTVHVAFELLAQEIKHRVAPALPPAPPAPRLLLDGFQRVDNAAARACCAGA